MVIALTIMEPGFSNDTPHFFISLLFFLLHQKRGKLKRKLKKDARVNRGKSKMGSSRRSINFDPDIGVLIDLEKRENNTVFIYNTAKGKIK